MAKFEALEAKPLTDENKILSKKHVESIPERESWTSKTEFLLSCIGYAIGIGNVCRFPYLCYRNGGGAFLVPYLLMLFLCGIPLFFMETTLGQFSNAGSLTVFKLCPLLKGSGYAIITIHVITIIYYNVLMAYPLAFLYHTFQGKLPWDNCDNSWNTELCVEFKKTKSTYLLSNLTVDQTLMKTPADEFFHHKILEISKDIGNVDHIVTHLFIFNAISWIIMYFCLQKGTKSLGKVVYFTATFPFVLLLVLFIRGVTLPGAIDGIWFYIYPQWDRLCSLKTWADAACQIFFSLGPGWGGMITMASYNDFRNNVKIDSIIIPIVNCGTSIFAGFVVFSVLGFMAHETGLRVDTVATGGPGLAFITYPEALSMMPVPHLWAVLFFIMLYLLGVDSLLVELEVIISCVLDENRRLRKYSSWVILSVMFLLACGSVFFVTNAGMYYIQLFDWYAASIPVILICLMEVLMVGWVYGIKNFVRDLEFMIQEKISIWWPFCWKYLTLVILILIFATTILFNTEVTYNRQPYPDWSIWIGWSTCTFSMVLIPIYMVYKLTQTPGNSILEKFKRSMKHCPDWGPKNPEIRRQWLTLFENEEEKDSFTDYRKQIVF